MVLILIIVHKDGFFHKASKKFRFHQAQSRWRTWLQVKILSKNYPLSSLSFSPFQNRPLLLWAVMAITWSKAHKWNGPNKVELMSRWEGEIYVCWFTLFVLGDLFNKLVFVWTYFYFLFLKAYIILPFIE